MAAQAGVIDLNVKMSWFINRLNVIWCHFFAFILTKILLLSDTHSFIYSPFKNYLLFIHIYLLELYN